MQLAVSAADLAPNWPQTLALALLIAALATLLPAWQAVRLEPLEALQAE